MKQKERITKWLMIEQFIEALKTLQVSTHKKLEIRREDKEYTKHTYRAYYAVFCKK